MMMLSFLTRDSLTFFIMSIMLSIQDKRNTDKDFSFINIKIEKERKNGKKEREIDRQKDEKIEEKNNEGKEK